MFAIVFTLSIVLFADSTSAVNTRVLIDPGHGGKDPGASGNGLKEKDLTLDVSKRVSSNLNSNYEVSTKMTRSSDKTVSLNTRTNMANDWNADLFLSVHINSGGGTGYEDYTHATYSESRSNKEYETTSPEVQQDIRTEIKKVLRKHDIKDRGNKTANFHVLRESEMPSVLLELLFIDTKSDAESLKNNEFKQDIANAISKGVANAFELKVKGEKPTTKADIPLTNLDTAIEVSNQAQDYTVTATNLNVRTGNTTNHNRIGSLPHGQTIKAIGKTSNNWYKFKYQGRDAFVSGKYLEEVSKPSKRSKTSSDEIWTANQAQDYTVTATSLNVRTGNTTSYNRIGSLTKGQTVKTVGRTSNNWYKIKYKGEDAFVSGEHVKLKAKPIASNVSESKTTKYKTTASLLNIRNKPATNGSKVIARLSNNSTVNVTKKVNNNWYEINYKGKKAYVSAKYIKQASKVNKNTKKQYKTTASLLNVRDKASVKNSKVVARLAKNATVNVIKKYNSDWYQIKYNGKTAYVNSKYIK